MDEARELDFSPVMASGEAPEVLETTKAAFDVASVAIEQRIVGDNGLSRSV
nr:hypothetical protein [Paracoccus lutimaris]